MSVSQIKAICFTVCIVCVIGLVVLGLAMIWAGLSSDFSWRVALTLGLFFLALSITLTVAGRVGRV